MIRLVNLKSLVVRAVGSEDWPLAGQAKSGIQGRLAVTYDNIILTA